MDTTSVRRGRRRRRLRSAVHGVRAGQPTGTGEGGDPELLALVAAPFTGLDDTHRRLGDLLAAFDDRDDRRAVFLSVYRRMTEAVADGVRAGDFEDPDWVRAYLVTFANLYRRALWDYERGARERVADAWQLAFDAAADGECLVVQDAALGVNAHINYDLALALDEVGVQGDRRRKYADHVAVIDVIAALVDETQDSLAARDADGLALVDDSLGSIDEWLTVQSIHECRESAWRTAVALRSRFRVRRSLACWLNDKTATGAAYLILSSRASERFHETLADLERSSVE
jgi:hypothetical protein